MGVFLVDLLSPQPQELMCLRMPNVLRCNTVRFWIVRLINEWLLPFILAVTLFFRNGISCRRNLNRPSPAHCSSRCCFYGSESHSCPGWFLARDREPLEFALGSSSFWEYAPCFHLNFSIYQWCACELRGSDPYKENRTRQVWTGGLILPRVFKTTMVWKACWHFIRLWWISSERLYVFVLSFFLPIWCGWNLGWHRIR